jgi:rsbT co-antagonist protein RsbR
VFRTLMQKGTFASLIFLIVLVTTASIAILNIFALRDSASHLSDLTIIQSDESGHFDVAMAKAIGAARAFILAGNNLDLAAAQSQLTVAREVLGELDPARHQEEDLGETLAAKYMQLYEQRQSLLEEARALIVPLQRMDSAQRQATLAKLNRLESSFAQLEMDVNDLLNEDTTAVAAAIREHLRSSLISMGVILLLGVLLPIGALILLRRAMIRPIQELSVGTTAIVAGKLDYVVRVMSQDEIGTLQRNFNMMTGTIAQQTRYLEQQRDTAHAARIEAETARAALADQLATIESQRTTIRDMSVPILPITPSTLVMPLVGALDSTRLYLVQEQALRAVERQTTKYLILDITGVPVVDTQVAHSLIKVAQATRLLGTSTMLVGIRPEVAQTLVDLGVRLDQVTTLSTLQSGIAYTLRDMVTR